MNGREALKALADGKRVRHGSWQPKEAHLVIASHGALTAVDFKPTPHPPWSYEAVAAHSGPFEEFVEPATDKQLIAEMERLAYKTMGVMEDVRAAYNHCAQMLRERKVAP